MSPAYVPPAAFEELLNAMCEGDLSAEQACELEAIVQNDDRACEYYLCYIHLHGTLHWDVGEEQPDNSPESHRAEIAQAEIAQSASGRAVPAGAFLIDTGDSPLPCLGAPVSQASGSFAAVLHTSAACLSSGWPAAYLIATVIFGVGVLIGTFTHVSHYEEVAGASRPTAERPSLTSPVQAECVGRITEMANCTWGPSRSVAAKGSPVLLGHKLDLQSGLIEITYDTGARVILQGPSTFEADSVNGGFLFAGKLTGKVEIAAAKGFSVRTPTAVVTDLGTEFGVNVDERGNTESHVFRGSVRLQALDSDGRPQADAKVLVENESARIDNRVVVLDQAAKTPDFVREIPRQTIASLDLADVVAGGNGFTGRRNHGVDPSTGRVVRSLPASSGDYHLTGDGFYHPVADLPLVDGVFIPNGGNGPVQVDSAGHTFSGFEPTDNRTYGGIWAGNVKPAMYAPACNRLREIDYDSPGHGLLDMLANKGITFDLEAIRRAIPGCKLLRFRALVGSAAPASVQDTHQVSDVWVLVDGKSRFSRRKLHGWNSAIPIVVPIADKDRFLTLATTDGGDGCAWDWLIFGDPRIDLLSTAAVPSAQPASHAAAYPEAADTRPPQMTFDANAAMIEDLTGGAPCSFFSPWSLGYRLPAGPGEGVQGVNLHPFAGTAHVACGESPVVGWVQSAIELGAVANTAGKDSYNVNRVLFDKNIICLHPGYKGTLAVLRWTAPRSGTVKTSTIFTAIDTATTDVHVLLSDRGVMKSLFDGKINAYAAPKTIRLDASQAAITVSAGDYIDVVVGQGDNQSNGKDSTGVFHAVTYLSGLGVQHSGPTGSQKVMQ